MKKAWPLFLVVLGACAPDITQNPAPSSDVVIAEFDPGNAAIPIVPAPNDLALDLTTHKIVVPIPAGCAGSTTARPSGAACGVASGIACDNGEACAIYSDCASGSCVAGKCVGGCPSDAQQEFNKDYLGNLVGGFPYESSAQAQFSGEVDPGTVNTNTVLVVDITTGAAVPVTDATIVPAPTAVIIQPPPKLWTRGHHYAVAVLGGANGVKAKNGAPVIGSTTWALVSSSQPLVTCGPDGCKPAIDIIPSTKSDPGERQFDQLQKAQQLEQIRTLYDPLLKELAGTGKNRDDVVLAWTFSIVDAAEVTFDPANNVLPFPNDLATNPTTHTVNLPNPKTGKPITAADCAAPTDQQVALVCGLNTLDGFSTLVAPISESSDTLGTLIGGDVDVGSLNAKDVGLVKLASKAPMGEQTTPSYTPCLNCVSTPKADGSPQTSPQQLQWKLNVPLDEKTTYATFVTTDVKDKTGKKVIPNPAFALFRSKASLLTADKHSAVTVLSDEQATQLEAARAAMTSVFDGLAAGGAPRSSLALASAFTTQSEGSVLAQLITLPAGAKAAGLPDVPLALGEITTAVKAQLSAINPALVNGVGKIFAGEFLTPDLRTGVLGTFNPDPTKAKPLPIQFILALPAAPPPATGYPVTIFGHGYTGSRENALLIASALNGVGQAVIVTDQPFHGARSSCTGSAAAIQSSLPMGVMATDDFACKDPPATGGGGGTMKCDEDPMQGMCVLTGGVRTACMYGKYDATGDGLCAILGQGRCAADNKCQGSAAAPVFCDAGCPVTGCGTQDLANAFCLGGGLGLCIPGAGPTAGHNVCSGSPATFATNAQGTPSISGWNMFSLTNFFQSRDNLRQEVIDLQQLVNILKSTTAAAPPLPAGLNLDLQALTASATPVIDATKINYAGQSLGGILGTLFNAVSPHTTNVALNVPGGAWSRLFLNSPAVASQRALILQTLHAAGIDPGTPAFDTFFGTIQWILDPADPANLGYRLTHPTMDATGVTAPNPNRHAFIQFIEGDQFVINETNFALVASANRMFNPMLPPDFACAPPLYCYEFTEARDGFDTTSLPLKDRHPFLLNFADQPITIKAQTQVALFVQTGAVQQ